MDTRTITIRSLNGICRNLVSDLELLPEDAFTKSFGPKSRTVADFVHEVNLVNDHVGLTLRKEALFPWPEGWVTAPANMQTKQAVIDACKVSCDKILATAEGMTSQEMETTIQTEDGETTPFERFRFITLHMWYHAGQINFIQGMLGDDVFHWH